MAASTPLVVPFVVLAPVWQRGWFQLMLAGALALLAFGLHRYRLQRFLQVERVRMRIATDLHDDIGSSLSQIAILSELARAGDGKAALSHLERIAEIARELVDSMSDIVWAINPRRDRVGDLTQRMRRYAGDVCSARQIEFSFEVHGGRQTPQRRDPA